MLISILDKINNFNEIITSPLNNFVSMLPMEEWAQEAVKDSLAMLPILFAVFVIIEIAEFYFSERLERFIKGAKTGGVAVGAGLSIFPQCGFSVIASSLYVRKIITRGCLIAVFLGTSDETIPILLANPDKAHLIIPIIGIKLFVAILTGYFIDVSTNFLKDEDVEESSNEDVEIHTEGCCSHDPESENKRELILHPIMHTVNVFVFILVITLAINYIMNCCTGAGFPAITSHKYMQCAVTAILGLIPNCAVSVAITMMLIKGTLTFAAAMSGLLTNAGLGLLVLLRYNNLKDTCKIVGILLLVAIITGFSIEFLV